MCRPSIINLASHIDQANTLVKQRVFLSRFPSFPFDDRAVDAQIRAELTRQERLNLCGGSVVRIKSGATNMIATEKVFDYTIPPVFYESLPTQVRTSITKAIYRANTEAKISALTIASKQYNIFSAS